MIQTSYSNFTRNTDAYVRMKPIPPTPYYRGDMSSLIAKYSLFYRDEKMKVMTQTLLGFYRCNNLGGFRQGQPTDSFHYEHRLPPIL